MSDPVFFTGRCLLAMPGMADPRFERAVIALCMHDADGAMGIDLGRTIDGVTAGEVFEQLDLAVPPRLAARPLFHGGPVQPERGFVIHGPNYAHGDTVDVAQRWGLTSSLSVLADIAAGRGPQEWRLALGYSGWGPGQLEEEMTRPGWMVADCPSDVLFHAAPKTIWQDAYLAAGIDPAALSIGFGAV